MRIDRLPLAAMGIHGVSQKEHLFCRDIQVRDSCMIECRNGYWHDVNVNALVTERFKHMSGSNLSVSPLYNEVGFTADDAMVSKLEEPLDQLIADVKSYIQQKM